jgi:predicted nuclease of predicted toxin-antitoxin system
MKLLADENFPFKSVLYLRNRGFDILSIGMDTPSVEDKQVIALAIKQKRTILTFDRDFGELIFREKHRPEKGIIYFRLNRYKAIEPGKFTEKLILKKFDFENALTVVDNNGIRQRRY